MQPKASVYLLYHFFHPDDVVSARLYSDLAEDLTRAGFAVTAMPSIRSCHDTAAQLPKHDRRHGVEIRRIYRPRWPQHRTWGRFGNTLFMLVGWTWRAAVMRRRPNEVMIVGTDPVLGVLAAISWRLLRPRATIIHWCHDLYPQAAIADGMISPGAWWVRLIDRLQRFALRRCDYVVDLGVCMRRLLVAACGESVTGIAAPSTAAASEQECAAGDASARRDADTSWRTGRHATIVPWSLVEPESVPPSDPSVRRELFGEARLGLLYSGHFGRAHHFDSVLHLAERLEGDDIGFCFAGRGLGLDELKKAAGKSHGNIRFSGFADEDALTRRLAAADVHIVTLRSSWTGAVVPSKFFGALAAGRPVLFAGSADSAIADWITRFGIGWVLTDATIEQVVRGIRELACDAERQRDLRRRCFEVYGSHFSRRVQARRWLALMQTQTTNSAARSDASYDCETKSEEIPCGSPNSGR